MIYLVSRHPGAVIWCQKKGVIIDTVLPHIQPTIIKQGDVVIGTLPINLAAEVQQAGGRYIHLSLQVPYEWRGMELTYEQLEEINACLQEYRIESIY